MAHGSGLDAQLGIAAESVYGTRVAPATFLPFESESLQVTPNYVDAQPLMAGVMVQPQGLKIQTTKGGEGSIETYLFDRSIGKLLNMLHGKTVTPSTPSGGTLSKQYVHEIGTSSPVGKSLSIQVGRPDTSGVVRPFDYVGCKVTQAEITVENDGAAMLSLDVDPRDEQTGAQLGAASYAANAAPFTFRNWAIDIGGSPHTHVRSLTITIPLGMETERFHLGNSGVKDEPLLNATSEIAVTASVEFASMADHNRLTAGAPVAVKATGTGALIEGSINYKTEISVPAAVQTSSAPVVAGPDLIVSDLEFAVVWDGTNPPLKITQINTDSAL